MDVYCEQVKQSDGSVGFEHLRFNGLSEGTLLLWNFEAY